MFKLLREIKDQSKCFETGRQEKIKNFSLDLLNENTITFKNCNSIDSIELVVRNLCKDLKENRRYEYIKLTKNFWGSQVSFESLVNDITSNIYKKIKDSMKSNVFSQTINYQIDTSKKYNTSFYTKISGVTIGNRQEYIKKYLYSGAKLNLTREKYNKFDPNAVAVYMNNYHIGYLPKERAKSIAKDMDNGINFECTVEKVTGGNGYNYGVNVKISNYTNINTNYYEDEEDLLDYEDMDKFMRDNGYDPEEDSIYDMYNWD